MSKLIYYAEVINLENKGEPGSVVDIYGYEDEVLIWGVGFCQCYKVSNAEDCIKKVKELIKKCEEVGFSILNEEDRRKRVS